MAELPVATAKSLVWGVSALVDPNKLTGWRAYAYWAGLAAASGYEATRVPYMGLPTNETVDYVLTRPEIRLALGTATAGLIFGARHELAAADSWTIKQLQRVGISNPRLALAVVTGAIVLASELLTQPTQEAFSDYHQEAPTPGPVPEKVRAVTEALLTSVDGHGSAELLEQLASAQSYTDENNSIIFVVAPETPPTLIDHYSFPAVGRFTHDGVVYHINLDVYEGRLSSLIFYPINDEEPMCTELPPVDDIDITVGFTQD